MSTYRGSITFCFLHFNSQVSSFCGPVFKKPGLKQAHASGLAQEQRGQEMCFHTRERWTRRSKGEPSIRQDWGRAKQDSIWTGPICVFSNGVFTVWWKTLPMCSFQSQVTAATPFPQPSHIWGGKSSMLWIPVYRKHQMCAPTECSITC